MQINQEKLEGRKEGTACKAIVRKQITAVTRKEQKKSPQREDVGQDLENIGKTQKMQKKKKKKLEKAY